MNRIFSAKKNQTSNPGQKFFRLSKQIESSLKVNQDFYSMNRVFHTNVSQLLRDVIRTLASEEIEETEDKDKNTEQKTPKLDFKIWKLPSLRENLELLSATHFGPLNRKRGLYLEYHRSCGPHEE